VYVRVTDFLQNLAERTRVKGTAGRSIRAGVCVCVCAYVSENVTERAHVLAMKLLHKHIVSIHRFMHSCFIRYL